MGRRSVRRRRFGLHVSAATTADTPSADAGQSGRRRWVAARGVAALPGRCQRSRRYHRPYRGYLFYWKTTRNDVIDEIGTSLWPYLGDAKRRQFAKAASEVNRVAPAAQPVRGTRTERAWAAGLFDGEGCFYLTAARQSTGWRGASLYLSQSSGGGPPDTIRRFHAAIEGLGTLSGPHEPRSPWSRLPQYHWQTS